jgi:hypothetical protein
VARSCRDVFRPAPLAGHRVVFGVRIDDVEVGFVLAWSRRLVNRLGLLPESWRWIVGLGFLGLINLGARGWWSRRKLECDQRLGRHEWVREQQRRRLQCDCGQLFGDRQLRQLLE